MNEEDANKVTLRDHFQSQLLWIDRYFQRQFDNAEKQVTLARDELDKRIVLAKDEIAHRLVELNKLREEVTEDRGQLVEKVRWEEWTDAMEKRMQSLERNQASNEGKSSISTILWAMAASVTVALIITFAAKLIK